MLSPSHSYLCPSAPPLMVRELGGIFRQNSGSSLLIELSSELGTLGQHWSHLWEFGHICFCDLRLWPSRLTAALFSQMLKTLYCFQFLHRPLAYAVTCSSRCGSPMALLWLHVATALVTGHTGSLDSCFPWPSVGLWDILGPVHSIQKSKQLRKCKFWLSFCLNRVALVEYSLPSNIPAGRGQSQPSLWGRETLRDLYPGPFRLPSASYLHKPWNQSSQIPTLFSSWVHRTSFT